MCSLRRPIVMGVVLPVAAVLTGCAAPKIDFAHIHRPPRAAELDAYDVFVGSWTWTAEMANVDGPGKNWTGSAEWKWALDKRCLEGTMTATTDSAGFEAAGVWSWHPKTRKYIWWMFNNWGYPQQGSATYDDSDRSWRMKYKSVGLDGTTSYGSYNMSVVDGSTLEWRVDEWADPFHTIKKMEMTGTYKRR